jgi:hypothetical protein
MGYHQLKPLGLGLLNNGASIRQSRGQGFGQQYVTASAQARLCVGPVKVVGCDDADGVQVLSGQHCIKVLIDRRDFGQRSPGLR